MAGMRAAVSAPALTIAAQVIIVVVTEVWCARAPSTLLKTGTAVLCVRLSSAWIRAR